MESNITHRYVTLMLVLFVTGACSPSRIPDQAAPQVGLGAQGAGGVTTDPFLEAGCTVIYGADDRGAFGGNNEDSPYPNTMVWFIPPEDGKYGRALIGYENFVWQGGVNDRGLFFDALVADDEVHVPQGDKPRYPGSLPGKALAECADVKCVKRMFEQYHAYDDWVYQFMYGDASGSSVIIEPRVMIDGGTPFQVATNFYQSRTDINECRFCERYWTARNLFEGTGGISAQFIRDILNEVHLEDDYPTQYSTVYDLKKGLIYLYHFHNYGSVVTFDLEEELAQGYHALRLVDLFPENPDFLDWAQPEMDRLAEKRSNYTSVEVDPLQFESYLGDYAAPDDFNTLYPYYSVALERGKLVLKMLPDKAWMALEPTSDRTFFHLSTMSEFKITFLPDEKGEINQFNYHYLDHDYLFTRVDSSEMLQGTQAIEEERVEPPAWTALLNRVGHFFGTNTFKLLAIVVGLVALQYLLTYLRSLII